MSRPSLYDRYVLPKLLTCACGAKPITKQREKVVPLAKGRVLELGIGGGLNLVFYDPVRVEGVVGVDPSPELRAVALAAPRPGGLSVDVVDGTAETLPFEDASFDCVVCTFTLCSVASPQRSLREARRVLRPGGLFLFAEHGLAPDADVVRWQRRIEPVWKRMAGGCHLTRPITAAIGSAGFRVRSTDGMYLPGTPRIAGWSEWGSASPA